ncbi:MAG: hypothetical protein A2073_01190 [Deltaproteobacteria bacterium GWC2_42_11]|nr:MAG: hypothetical protein A2073_01190 [Deltaproteobacteria bacterium GWC2_42_11]HBO84842.1 hypothetical protein [Deltaproteobacteria bacterium]
MAEILNGYGSLSYSTSETGTSTSSTLSETAELNWTRKFSPMIRYRLGLGLSHSSTTSDGTVSESTILKPSIDGVLTGTVYSLRMGYTLTSTASSNSNQNESSDMADNLYARLALTPRYLLPPVNISYNIDRNWNNEGTVDTIAQTMRASTSFSFKNLASLYYSMTSYTTEDNITGETAQSTKETLSLSLGTAVARLFTFSLLDNTLTITPGYTLTYSAAPQGATIQIANPLAISAALSGKDSTPTFDALTATPSLKDDDRTTGVEIGNGNEGAYQNIGFQLSNSSQIQTAYIYLKPGFDSTLANSFKFDSYISDDGTVWTKISGSVTYNTTENRFEIKVNRNTKFFKAVVTGNTSQSVLATEVAASGPAGTETTWSDTISHNITLSAGYKPFDKIFILYDMSLSLTTAKPSDQKTTAMINSLGLKYDPKDYLSLNLSYQNAFSSTEQPAAEPSELTSNTYSFASTFIPTDTMTYTLGISTSESITNGVTTGISDSITFSSALKLYRGLDSNFTVGISMSEDPVNNAESTSYRFSLGVTAQLTDRLRAVGDYTLAMDSSDSSATSSELTATSSELTTHSSDLKLTYTFSPRLKIGGAFSYTTGEDSSSFRQSYDVGWRVGDRLSADLSYSILSEVKDSATTESSQIGLNMSWNVSKDILTYLTYGFSESDGTNSNSLFIGINIRL